MQWVIFKLPFTSFSKQVLVQNHSNENVFDLHKNGHAGEPQSFSYEWFCTKTAFDTEAKRNSEMAYLVILFPR